MNRYSTKRRPPKPASGTADRARLKFWGVRGSIPTPGRATIRYGGNTSCVEFRAAGQIIILDAGTGVRLLGQELLSEFNHQPIELTLLLTHTHWDHIQGLPFFLPVYKPQNHLRILGYEGARHGLEDVLKGQMESPFFPIGLREVPANVRIEELTELDFHIGPVRVRARQANHPGKCFGYRLDAPDGSIAFFPDHESGCRKGRLARRPRGGQAKASDAARAAREGMIDFLRGTDVLIMDTQFDAREYRLHVGWGHGCLDDVIGLALAADVKRLFLFHHDPNHDDKKVAQMVAHARRLASAKRGSLAIDAAREGLTLKWPLRAETSRR